MACHGFSLVINVLIVSRFGQMLLLNVNVKGVEGPSQRHIMGRLKVPNGGGGEWC